MTDHVTPEEWPYGLRCMDCDESLMWRVYSKRLVGMADDMPVTEIICVPCSLEGALTA